MRVAVIGARGIGKQHAKWFHLEGCDVVAFAGTNQDQLARTATAMSRLFPFSGNGYTDLEAMFREERPDIIVVASPHSWHVEHALAALDYHAHVYLEKPFLWDESKTHVQLISESAVVVKRAKQDGLLIGMNTQYACVWDAYRTFLDEGTPDLDAAKSLFVEMESRNLGGERRFQSVWADLGSHPISMLLKLMPDGTLIEESAYVDVLEKETAAKFQFRNGERGNINVEFRCRSAENRDPIRTFGIDGINVEYYGRSDASGVFRTFLRHGNREQQFTDLMQESIRRFVSAVRSGSPGHIAASGEDGHRNLELQLKLLSFADDKLC